VTKKVLIVEDYDDAREFMRLLIESFGYETFTAANGLDAVIIARKEIPNLILMDISLPEMYGLQATTIIRNSPDIPIMPIVAVTAFGKDISSEAIKAGCNQVICKPFDFDSLEFVINQYLRH
jgi:two-component system cell cycle response regulator DivK